jgi:hypothetical protein
MSTSGAHIRAGRLRRLLWHAPPPDAAAAPSPARTPYWLLWSTGAVAVMLGIAAFLLWGLTGAATLLDMIVAFCT